MLPAKNSDTSSRVAEKSVNSTEISSSLTQNTSTEIALARLGELAGFDLKFGLPLMRYNTEKYLQLIKRFIESRNEGAQDISNHLSLGDRETAQRLAHSLKGSAGS